MRRSLLILALFLALLAAPHSGRAYDEPDFGAESIVVLAPLFPQGYWWDHTTLTVRLKAAGNVDESSVAAIRDAMAYWNAAIAHRHGAGFVQLVEVTGDPVAAAQADITVNFHAQGGALYGVAICTSGKRCQVPLWAGDQAAEHTWVAVPLSYEQRVALAMHELGHVLGIGHTEPLFGTLDLMGYGIEGEAPFTNLAVSACDMDAFDIAWAWAINGTDPAPPTATEVVCA